MFKQTLGGNRKTAMYGITAMHVPIGSSTARQAWTTTVCARRPMPAIPEKTINKNKQMPDGIRL